jgi:PKD repeat protein
MGMGWSISFYYRYYPSLFPLFLYDTSFPLCLFLQSRKKVFDSMKWSGKSDKRCDAGRTSAGIRLGFTVCLVFTLFLIICGSAGADNGPVVNATLTDGVNATVNPATQTVLPTITDFMTTVIPTTAANVPAILSGSQGQQVASLAVNPVIQQAVIDHKVMPMHNITAAQRMAAAEAAAAQGLTVGTQGGYSIESAPSPGSPPDYFGPYSNYANSQLPTNDTPDHVVPGTGIRKFVDSLPGLTSAGQNNLGQYIPVASADTAAYPGDDYYEIALVQYFEKMHSDVAPTTLRGYVQLETPNITGAHYPLIYPNGSAILNATGFPMFAVDKPHYLGPIIVAQKDKPVRIKFQNMLPTGSDGNLFIPVDTSIMGAGVGPDGVNKYKENRATIHLHGGNTPWISDGTPHQWTTPAGENTPYPEGVSVKNVPDMDGGNEPTGTLTFYYTNQQSARLLFYHDHAYGITRLNVYAGEAAGYLVRDSAESGLIAGTYPGGGVIPGSADEIPLVIEDKSFVPNAAQMLVQDPTWDWGNKTKVWPYTGDLYYPHVYMPNQNPSDPNNVNPMGRWDYGPWFWPPFTGFLNQPIPNAYVGNGPWEPALMPATPNPSQTPESFMDTPVVNGAAYPYVKLGPHAYRFRILNACNDRTLNLQLYRAGSDANMWTGTTLNDGNAGEVNIAPATPGELDQPADWPTDGRDGGVPWANMSGPSWYQIGTEGGFLPAPVVIPSRPIDYDTNHNYGGVLNINNHSLMLMPAQRADVIVDFSGIPDGTKLILYNDNPAPAPGGDPRYDYYTGDPNQTLSGGAPTTYAGYGPNTRTIMQIQIDTTLGSAPAFNLNALNTSMPYAYAQYQDKPLVPESVYGAAFGTSYADNFVNLTNTSVTFVPAGQVTPATIGIKPKAVIGDFEMAYGRLTALLGIEIPRTPTNIESRVPLGYIDPPTEILNNSVTATPIGTMSDGTEIWKVSNNDVDLHPLHWHMVNVQVLNRIIWDGTVVPPEANELGWKETVNIPPLTDTIIAIRPIKPTLPWELPNSIRPLDVITPLGTSSLRFTNLDPTGGQAPTTNHLVNFGWEYVYHCHILGHEENDFMRPMSVAVAPKVPPSGLTALWMGPNSSPTVNLSWQDNSVSETNWTVQRALNSAGPWTDLAVAESLTGPATGGIVHYYDQTVALNTTYYYQIRATNWVGDITTYSWTSGYPNMAVNSTPSVMASPVLSGISFTDFEGVPTSGIAPLPVTFTDKSTGSSTWWNWTFGDGSYSDLQNPVHTYLVPGIYTVTLHTNNLAGSNTTTKWNYITVSAAPIPPPIADFSGTPTQGIAPRSVTFTDSSSNTPIAWQWTFGDGTYSGVQNPVHNYLYPGNFTVTLTASNAGGSDTLTRTRYINVSAAPITPPEADFTGTPTEGIAPRSVTFSDDSDNAPTAWQWTFGDGSYSGTQNPVHNYLYPGNFTVTLTASNAGGSDTMTRVRYINISAAPIAWPVAGFSGTPTEGIAPRSVTFTDSSTNSPTAWQWTFGDGTYSGVQSPVHNYLFPGNFTVTLTASNAGNSSTMTRTRYINVSAAPIAPPVAGFTGSPTSGKAPLSVTFTDSSTNSPTAWQWTFGDGNTSGVQSPVHIYEIPGNFTVSLTASNAGGSSTMTRSNYINVSESLVITPVANFTGRPTRGKVPLTVTFTDSSRNAPTAWSWTFGDGNATGATLQNPVHTYFTLGNFTVSLTASNTGGSSTLTRTEYIHVTNATDKIAVFFNGQWWLDYNGNGAWDGSVVDKYYEFGGPGNTSVIGDWNGDGRWKVGVYNNASSWFLDYDGDGVYSPGVDKAYTFGGPGNLTVIGDWNGDGKAEIGLYNPVTSTWYLDMNGNGILDPATDIKAFGSPGSLPVIGDWNGDGITEIGTYNAGTWQLDYNGNGVWDGTGVGLDRQYTWGWSASSPIVGDWNGDGTTKVAVYYNGAWWLDYNGNGVWDGAVIDRQYTWGWSASSPLVGDWNSDGRKKIAVYYNGAWWLDYNGNGVWDGAVIDRQYTWGWSASTPLVAPWSG